MNKLKWYLIRLLTTHKGDIKKTHIIYLANGRNVTGLHELKARVNNLKLGETYIKQEDNLIDGLLGHNKSTGMYIKAGESVLLFIPKQNN